MPNDERHQAWLNAISAHAVEPYKGLICINHFHEDDLVIGRQITLKKDTVPKIFNAAKNNAPILFGSENRESGENNEEHKERCNDEESVPKEKTTQSAGDSASISDISCENNEEKGNGEDNVPKKNTTKSANKGAKCDLCEMCEIVKAEKESLRQEYIELEANNSLKIAKLENEIKKLKMESEIKKSHIKYLSAKVYRKEKSEESLKTLLKDLEEENVITRQAYDALEVSCSSSSVQPVQHISCIQSFCVLFTALRFLFLVFLRFKLRQACIILNNFPSL